MTSELTSESARSEELTDNEDFDVTAPLTWEALQEHREVVQNIAAGPGRELRRESIEAVWRFARLGTLSGRDDQYVEIRALDCLGPNWVWQPDKNVPDVLPGTAVAYVRTAKQAIERVLIGDDGHLKSPLRVDMEGTTDARLAPVGYYYIPGRFSRNAIHENFDVGPNAGHLGWQKVYGSGKLIDDKHVEVVTVLSVDVDPKRSEPNANEDEHVLAVATAWRIKQLLRTSGVPEGALGLGSSGNGGRCDLAVELPVDADYRPWVGRYLTALARIFDQFDGNRQIIDIDQACANPSRLIPLLGSVKAKGMHTDERPQRRTWFKCAEAVTPIDKAMFHELVIAIEAKAQAFPDRTERKIQGELREPPANLDAISVETRKERSARYLARIAPAVAKAEGGTGRHSTYVAVCCTVARGFALDEEAALEVLTQWHQSCRPPKPEQEFRQMVKYAVEKGSMALGAKLGRRAGKRCKPADWDKYFLTGKGNARKPCRENVIMAMRYDDGLENMVAFDEFAQDIVFRRSPPWTSTFPGSAKDTPVGSPWKDVDDHRCSEYLSRRYKLRSIAQKTISEALLVVARDNPWHPLREWLDSLKWDGVARVGAWGPSVPKGHPTCKPWLEEYCLADVSYGFLSEDVMPEQAEKRGRTYVQLAGMWFLLQMVARAYQPGAKCDSTVCLEGGQGLGKSSLLRALAGPNYFSDGDLGDVTNKEAVLQIQGVWLQELAEGAIFSRASRRDLKGFLSKEWDYIIPKFSNRRTKYPRQTVFAPTTNEGTYLDDSTGERRYLPVRFPDTREEEVDIDRALESGKFQKPVRLDLARIKADRAQLFAEAVYLYKRGVKWWPESVLEERLCDMATGMRKVEHPLRDKVADVLRHVKDAITLRQVMVLVDMGDVSNLKNGGDALKIRGYMQDLGWKTSPKRTKHGQAWIRGPKAAPYVEPPLEDEGEQAQATKDGFAQKDRSKIKVIKSDPDVGVSTSEDEREFLELLDTIYGAE